MNTRRYARTLDEAFRHTADYGCAVTRYERPRAPRLVWVVVVVLLGLLLCAAR